MTRRRRPNPDGSYLPIPARFVVEHQCVQHEEQAFGQESALARVAQLEQEQTMTHEKRTLLIVDDEPDLVVTLDYNLRKEGLLMRNTG